MACRRLPVPAVLVISFPSLIKVKAISGWAKLKRLRISTIWDSSACWLFKYLRRAGVLKKRSSTVILVPTGLVAGSTSSISPPFATNLVPWAAPSCAVRRVRILTEAMEGMASPRKPSVRIRKRSAWLLILLVACRRRAKATSSCAIPSPLSVIRIDFNPASSISTTIWLAPASIEFSTNSLTTLAGRSITSPAAIWLAKTSGNSIICDMSAPLPIFSPIHVALLYHRSTRLPFLKNIGLSPSSSLKTA